MNAPLPIGPTCGKADVAVDGVVQSRDIVFGGVPVFVRDRGLPLRTYDIQTVHPPAGAIDTMLLAYGSDWQEIGFDNDGGIGWAAALRLPLRDMSVLVVGSMNHGTSGNVNVLFNECEYSPDESFDGCRSWSIDRDGDGLANQLETDLATNPDSADTDGDGINDWFEVYGRRHGAPLELPRLGANPRRRDLFVEVDRERNPQGQVAAVLTEDEIDLIVEDIFLDLPRLPLNPDGTRGIFVHIDTGGWCPNRLTLCGAWNGTREISASPTIAVNDPDAPRTHMDMSRHGVFHWGIRSIGAPGQAKVSAAVFYASGPGELAHELGHNLGLNHWGPDGIPAMNYKANYPSTMNYAFSYSLPIVSPTRGRFSEGTLATLDGPVHERDFSTGRDLRFLTEGDFRFPMADGVIDLNRDGRVGDAGGGFVQADYAPLDRTIDGPWPHIAGVTSPVGGIAPNVVSCQPGPGGVCLPSGGSALTGGATAGTSMYIVSPYLRTEGRTQPYFQTISQTGVPLHAAPYAVGTLDGLRDGECAAEAFTSGSNTSILTVYPDRDGRLNYAVFQPSPTVQTPWQVIPGWRPGGVARQASTARVGNEIWIIWRDTALADQGDNVYVARYNIVTGSWTPANLQQLQSMYTPGVAPGPDGRMYAVLLSRQRQVSLHYQSTGSMSPVWTAAPETISAAVADFDSEPTQRLQLAFAPLRSTAESTFADGSGQLIAYWTEYDNRRQNRDTWKLVRATSGGFISPHEQRFLSWAKRAEGSVDRPHPTYSPSVVRRGNDIAVVHAVIDWNSTSLRGVQYFPYANGVVPGFTGHVDVDDASVLASSMCVSLWTTFEGEDRAACRCAGRQTCPSLSKAATAINYGETVTCDGLQSR
jgi:hypothetical protein